LSQNIDLTDSIADDQNDNQQQRNNTNESKILPVAANGGFRFSYHFASSCEYSKRRFGGMEAMHKLEASELSSEGET
jgi:hypothetical protein